MNPKAAIFEPGNYTNLLNKAQEEGMSKYGLSFEDVTSPNFDHQTLKGMSQLLAQNRAPNYLSAFNILRGLNPPQITGIVNFGLSRNHVLTLNFGNYTLKGMTELLVQNRAPDHLSAFNMLKGLDRLEISKIVKLGYDRTQVTNTNSNQHSMTPHIRHQNLGDNLSHGTISTIPKFQVQSQDKNLQDDGFSVEKIDAYMYLISKNILSKKALEIALTLNSKQIYEMINSNSTLAQVQDSNFKNTFHHQQASLQKKRANPYPKTAKIR